MAGSTSGRAASMVQADPSSDAMAALASGDIM